MKSQRWSFLDYVRDFDLAWELMRLIFLASRLFVPINNKSIKICSYYRNLIWEFNWQLGVGTVPAQYNWIIYFMNSEGPVNYSIASYVMTDIWKDMDVW